MRCSLCTKDFIPGVEEQDTCEQCLTDTKGKDEYQGMNHPVNGVIHRNEVHTIVEESDGPGASKWGRLKSGAGWVSLDFVKKMR